MVMRKVFKSRKDTLFKAVTWGTILTLLFVTGIELRHVVQSGHEVQVFGLILLASVTGLMLWLWFDTRYAIDEVFVHFRSGPLRGKIRVSAISEVVIGETMWSGFKPALARKGVIVKYNRYDEIYFSPDSNDAFVAALRNVNPDIRIVVKGKIKSII